MVLAFAVLVVCSNTGGFATLHVRDKYFGGFAVNSKSGFASNEKVEIYILDTILVYLTIFSILTKTDTVT